MATFFPIYLRYKKPDGKFQGKSKEPGSFLNGRAKCRLFVNPTTIDVVKTPSIATTRTMGGNVFQPYPNQPDTISFKGIMYGLRSVQDFKVLQNVIDQRPELKEVILQYKWKEYHGFVTAMNVSADAKDPRMFNYGFTFISKDAFSLSRMMLGQLTGYQVDADYFKQVYYGIQNQFIANPLQSIVNIASFGIASIGGDLLATDKAMNGADPTDFENL